jgi:hypothetical protein
MTQQNFESLQKQGSHVKKHVFILLTGTDDNFL